MFVLLIPQTQEERPLTQIMVKLEQALYLCSQAVSPVYRVREISIGHGENKGFIAQGYGAFKRGIGRQIGGVTEGEHKRDKVVIT